MQIVIQAYPLEVVDEDDDDAFAAEVLRVRMTVGTAWASREMVGAWPSDLRDLRGLRSADRRRRAHLPPPLPFS